MAHTRSTTNYNLPQFDNTDKPTWLGDINGAFLAIDTAMHDNAGDATEAKQAATSALAALNNALERATTADTKAGQALTAATSASETATAAAATAASALTAADAASALANANKLIEVWSNPNAGDPSPVFAPADVPITLDNPENYLYILSFVSVNAPAAVLEYGKNKYIAENYFNTASGKVKHNYRLCKVDTINDALVLRIGAANAQETDGSTVTTTTATDIIIPNKLYAVKVNA